MKRNNGKRRAPRKKEAPVNETQTSAANTNGFNDYAWYNTNPLLSEAAGRIPFPYRPGMDIAVYENGTGTGPTVRKIPGVAALHWVPSIGRSETATDPASIAAREIFSRVRSVFSGSIDADAPDFMIYMLALDSIFSYIGSLKRIYRILDAHTPENYNWPDSLLAALLPAKVGVQPVEVIRNFRENKAQFWQYINELVGMTRKFRCPDIFPLFKRHYWMNDNVYTDAPTPNSQSYVFVQDAFYKFGLDTVSEVQVGSVSLEKVAYTNPVEAYQFGRKLIDALGNGDDAYIISGYLTRAYDGSAIFGVEEMAAYEPFTPYYLPEVLEQIHNTFTVGDQLTADSLFPGFKVTQDPLTNAIVSRPTGVVANLNSYVPVTPKLSVSNPAPGAIDVIEASRLSGYIDESGNIIVGTEAPLYWSFYNGGANVATIQQVVTIPVDSQSMVAQAKGWQPLAFFDGYSFLSAFDWAPRVIVALKVAEGSPAPFTAWEIWETKNVTVLSEEEVKQINRVCLLSEFNVFAQ